MGTMTKGMMTKTIKDKEFFRQSLGLLTEDNRIYRHEGTKALIRLNC